MGPIYIADMPNPRTLPGHAKPNSGLNPLYSPCVPQTSLAGPKLPQYLGSTTPPCFQLLACGVFAPSVCGSTRSQPPAQSAGLRCPESETVRRQQRRHFVTTPPALANCLPPIFRRNSVRAGGTAVSFTRDIRLNSERADLGGLPAEYILKPEDRKCCSQESNMAPRRSEL